MLLWSTGARIQRERDGEEVKEGREWREWGGGGALTGADIT